MKKNIFFAGCALLLSGVASGQQGDNYFKSITQHMGTVAQSPTAAGLGKYGAYPVNESTGTPHIEIPIYQVNIGHISFPISLSYHGSGIKVNEQASWVGLGFSLNAGGVITRKVQGLADDDVSDGQDKGFFQNYNKVQNNPGSLWEITNAYPEGLPYMDFKLAIDEGRFDFMPDLFFYNFAGKTGSFTLLPEGVLNNEMQLKPVLSPVDDILVEPSMPLPGKLLSFKITDNEGLVYQFNMVEQNLYNLSTTHPVPAQTGDPSVNTAWYLGSISDPRTGAQVNFSYEADTLDTDKSWVCQKNVLVPGSPGACSYTAEINRDAYSHIVALRLKSISYEHTRIDFNTASAYRQDVAGSASALDNISIYKNQQLVEKHELITDYFTATSGTGNLAKRLKLLKVQQVDPATLQVIGSYSFDYNSTGLPARGSFAQDLWGYYKSGASKYPVQNLIYGSSVPYYTFSSESRMPGVETIAGTLSKITYPTGGHTLFTFENNRYWANDPVYQITTRTNATNVNTTNYATAITTPFTISATTKFHFNSMYTPSIISAGSSGNPIGPCPVAGSTALYKAGTSAAILSFTGTMEFDIDLAPGTYHFESVIQQDVCTNAMVRVNCDEYKVVGYNHSKIGPGLRIASIENYDQFSNQTQKTEYTYETDQAGHSSGTLFYHPQMVSQWEQLCGSSTGTTDQYYTLHFNDIANSGNMIGSAVYYSTVTKKISGAQSGKVVNTYHNQGLPVTTAGVPSFFMSEPYKNGQLASTRIYDESGLLLQQKSYTNSITPSNSNYGFYAYTTINNTTALGSDQIKVHKYEIKSASVQLAQEVHKEYRNGQELKTITDYVYNNPEQKTPSVITTTFDDGTKEVMHYQYARDFNLPVTGTLSSAMTGIQKLQDAHIHTIPLEQYSATIDAQNNTKVTAGSYLEVSATHTGAPDQLYELQLDYAVDNFTPATVIGNALAKDARYEIMKEYSGFNPQGKPSLVVERTGNASLLWGYGGRYLVCRLEYIDHTALQNYLGSNPMVQQTLDNPASATALLNAIQQLRTAFPEALISGYAYEPGIGISHMSDANSQISSYIYDGLGRLLEIKDQDGHILKSYEYQYQTN